MICCPYIGVFTGERERFPSWIDDPVPPDSEKEDGNDSSKGLFLERMSQVAITLRMMLPARGAAFDIREEKGHGSCGEIGHQEAPSGAIRRALEYTIIAKVSIDVLDGVSLLLLYSNGCRIAILQEKPFNSPL